MEAVPQPIPDPPDDGPPGFACCGACAVWALLLVATAVLLQHLLTGRRPEVRGERPV